MSGDIKRGTILQIESLISHLQTLSSQNVLISGKMHVNYQVLNCNVNARLLCKRPIITL